MVKGAIQSHLPGELWVKGELSNFRAPSSGHLYFTLKDDTSTLKCVMFRSRVSTLRFVPEDGLSVLALGRIGVYEASGQYQLYVDSLEPLGRGALQLAFEQLRSKLEREGLFAAEHKVPIPQWPSAIGVVTSATGAAIADIIRVAKKRWPPVRMIVCPASVQGTEAPETIALALRTLDDSNLVDTIIVGRGGGSLEELSAFNDERVARAIFACRTPVISAVGHEVDFTISDFVADARAATPSAAAAMAVPDAAEVRRMLQAMETGIQTGVQSLLRKLRNELEGLNGRLWAQEPLASINRTRQYMDDLSLRSAKALERKIGSLSRELELIAARLDAASPLGIMKRGYSIVTRIDSKRVVKSVRDVSAGDHLIIQVVDGTVAAAVTKAGGGHHE